MSLNQTRDRYESIPKRNFKTALIKLLERDYKLLGSRKILEILSDDIEELLYEFNYSKDKIDSAIYVFLCY